MDDYDYQGITQDDLADELANVARTRFDPLPKPYHPPASGKKRVSIPIRSPNGNRGFLIFLDKDKGRATATWMNGCHAIYRIHYEPVTQ